MHRYWWVYISLILVLGLIGVLTYQNEKAYQHGCEQRQREQTMRDSNIAQIVKNVDTLTISIEQIAERVEELGAKIDTMQTIQKEQLKNDNKQVRELRQIRRAINKCNKKSEK